MSLPCRWFPLSPCSLTAQPQRPGVSAAYSASWLDRGRTCLKLPSVSYGSTRSPGDGRTNCTFILPPSFLPISLSYTPSLLLPPSYSLPWSLSSIVYQVSIHTHHSDHTCIHYALKVLLFTSSASLWNCCQTREACNILPIANKSVFTFCLLVMHHDTQQSCKESVGGRKLTCCERGRRRGRRRGRGRVGG